MLKEREEALLQELEMRYASQQHRQLDFIRSIERILSKVPPHLPPPLLALR
jgi:hypothetical protein